MRSKPSSFLKNQFNSQKRIEKRFLLPDRNFMSLSLIQDELAHSIDHGRTGSDLVKFGLIYCFRLYRKILVIFLDILHKVQNMRKFVIEKYIPNQTKPKFITQSITKMVTY